MHKNQDVSKILKEDLNEKYEEKVGRQFTQMKEQKALSPSENLDIPKQSDTHGEDGNSALYSSESREQGKKRGSRPAKKKPTKLSVVTQEDGKSRDGKAKTEDKKEGETPGIHHPKELSLDEKIRKFINPEFAKEIDDKVKRGMFLSCYP